VLRPEVFAVKRASSAFFMRISGSQLSLGCQSVALAIVDRNFVSDHTVRFRERTLKALCQLCGLGLVCSAGLEYRTFIASFDPDRNAMRYHAQGVDQNLGT
jgi:hypothetical protein